MEEKCEVYDLYMYMISLKLFSGMNEIKGEQ